MKLVLKLYLEINLTSKKNFQNEIFKIIEHYSQKSIDKQ